MGPRDTTQLAPAILILTILLSAQKFFTIRNFIIEKNLSETTCFSLILNRCKQRYEPGHFIKDVPGSYRRSLAEKEGFEPSMRYQRIHEFQSCAINRARRLLHCLNSIAKTGTFVKTSFLFFAKSTR